MTRLYSGDELKKTPKTIASVADSGLSCMMLGRVTPRMSVLEDLEDDI